MRRITLRSDLLTEAEYYIIALQASTPGSFVGHSNVTVLVSSRPYGGTCAVSSSEIIGIHHFFLIFKVKIVSTSLLFLVKVREEVVISCSGWRQWFAPGEPVNLDINFLYTFYYQTRDSDS